MSKAKGKRFRIATLSGACLLAVLSLPLLYATAAVVKTWIQFHSMSRHGFYVEHWLGATVVTLSLACILLALVGFSTALRASWPRWRALALPVGIVLALTAMVWIPNVPLWYSEFASNANHLASVRRLLENWRQSHDRFPLTGEELQSALQQQGVAPSPYAQAGKHLDYEIQLEPGQSGPSALSRTVRGSSTTQSARMETIFGSPSAR